MGALKHIEFWVSRGEKGWWISLNYPYLSLQKGYRKLEVAGRVDIKYQKFTTVFGELWKGSKPSPDLNSKKFPVPRILFPVNSISSPVKWRRNFARGMRPSRGIGNSNSSPPAGIREYSLYFLCLSGKFHWIQVHMRLRPPPFNINYFGADPSNTIFKSPDVCY